MRAPRYMLLLAPLRAVTSRASALLGSSSSEDGAEATAPATHGGHAERHASLADPTGSPEPQDTSARRAADE